MTDSKEALQAELDQLRAEIEKETKRFKKRKLAHENELKRLSQEIQDKEPVLESVRSARFFAQQYRELTNNYIQQLVSIGFEGWIESDPAAPADAIAEIDETCKWLIGRIDKYLSQATGKQDLKSVNDNVITIDVMRG